MLNWGAPRDGKRMGTPRGKCQRSVKATATPVGPQLQGNTFFCYLKITYKEFPIVLRDALKKRQFFLIYVACISENLCYTKVIDLIDRLAGACVLGEPGRRPEEQRAMDRKRMCAQTGRAGSGSRMTGNFKKTFSSLLFSSLLFSSLLFSSLL